MKKIHLAFSKSADAAALYADALMVQHPWDLYDRYSNPRPWTPEIVKVLEGILKEFPGNPGANHYYIHAIEGSRHPEKGLTVADRLGDMMPGVSHLVHMPSHIYIRSGQYKKGIESNEKAIKGYYDYLAKYPVTVNGSFLYLAHNQHMQAACAMMDGQYKNALRLSLATNKSSEEYLDAGGYFGIYGQYLFMSPCLTYVRFGKWDEILKADSISETRVYAHILWRFSRGMAYARKHQPEEAVIELQKMQSNKTNPQLKESPAAFNPGLPAVELAEKILEAVIAEEKNQLDISIKLLKEATDKEDAMLYNEPKDWLLPARQYLGNALLKFKQYAAAEKVYKEDLLINPDNAWSLTGLEKALNLQKKTKEALGVKQRLKKAMERSDVRLMASVY
jgi:tetratricopeptide (TPR) repeat protein